MGYLSHIAQSQDADITLSTADNNSLLVHNLIALPLLAIYML